MTGVLLTPGISGSGPYLFFIAISIESWVVRPAVLSGALGNPLCWLGFLIISFSAVALIYGLFARLEMIAFWGSNVLIMGLLTIGGTAIFQVILYSTLAPQYSLTVYAVASSPSALLLASFWWPVGFVLASTYFVFISRRYAGKVSVKRDIQGFY